MSILMQKFIDKQLDSANKVKQIPEFKAGDTIRVFVKIVDGNTERTQMFEGVCIRRRNHDIGSTFTVKKISNGEMVERTFMVYSPKVEKIEVVKIGRVRRAKLYYMRERTGKAARIRELNKFTKSAKNTKKAEAATEAEPKVEEKKAAEKQS